MFLDRRKFAQRLLRWYDRDRRDLPWRVPIGQACNPYHVFLSEAMLQQTQVATVIPYFLRFIERYPTLQDLAGASERDVLRLWQGLGYYSRARNLLEAARRILRDHQGIVPRDVEVLLNLPGVGRYTAGAIASIGFHVRAPIVDGNVARVLCRLDCIESDPRERRTSELLWTRAAQILPEKRCGDFNSALMELGATICTPRSPDCQHCPVRDHCEAFAAGLQDQIPPPRKAKPVPLIHRHTFCLRDPKTNRWLIEQRPSKGRWAGMWQFVTGEADESPVTPTTVLSLAGVKSSHPRLHATLSHGLTHRKYQFQVHLCDLRGPVAKNQTDRPRRWVRLSDLHRYPLPRVHVRIAQMLSELESAR